ncbi:hypothetical protein BABINDRAFT_163368 [Babjeviella inositovora NRRL Y-12698]|uniref:Thiamine phosphate synthase/TenI domain-containing protein n=1 Tax=Babjeviella inositovora NRRL Y-12698 TaxID=984486 RepID=A0A1E3QKN8_9ASCO|nr:uncharacterized protein BABINDRAFT_163368 [Babjeviella inositovora NRRL Y-12698]ODQ77652.1 hypothetical protein BABINDRAFT_163368 [Babjeviella inositovora NRRL Y-12698]
MQFDKSKVDYSLYLVTCAELIPEGIDFLDQVRAAIASGVTILQLREKNLDTRAFIARARAVHELTQEANIPLIINDRVDVALAVDAEGVHVGQDDMPADVVRQLIGDDKIIGVSCDKPNVTRVAIAHRVDYIGIGPVFDTNTKKLTKIPVGPSGVREVLECLREEGGMNVKSVIIGGINHGNIQRVMYTTTVPGKACDGAAVVSCILATTECAKATRELCRLIKEKPAPAAISTNTETAMLMESSCRAKLMATSPMVHHITNGVAKNFQANVTLAVGASPIMSECAEEYLELAAVPNTALVLNTGTITQESISLYTHAIACYNRTGAPIIYDPVGAGATSIRRDTVHRLLNTGLFTVIKGNVGEILAAAAATTTGSLATGELHMRGVDSIASMSTPNVILVAKKLALANRAIVVVTGTEDIIVDGWNNGEYLLPQSTPSQAARVVRGGHPLMGKVTASGCSLGSVIAAFVAANPGNAFEATVTAVSLYKSAGYFAGVKAEKRGEGSGSFLAYFVDSLYHLTDGLAPDAPNTKVMSM